MMWSAGAKFAGWPNGSPGTSKRIARDLLCNVAHDRFRPQLLR
jgi:hypothetical protein